MTTERTKPVPEGYVHVELPPTQVRGFDKLFATLAAAFDEPAPAKEPEEATP